MVLTVKYIVGNRRNVRGFTAVSLVAVAFLLSPAVASADWTHPHGSAAQDLSTSAPDDVGSWTFDVGVEVSSQLVYDDGTVYFYAQDGDLHAFDPGRGTRAWVYEMGGPAPDSPVVDNGTVYAVSADRLVAIEQESGDLEWQVGTRDNVVAAPTVHDGTVYVMDGHEMRAIDAGSGTEDWSIPVDLFDFAEFDQLPRREERELSIRHISAADKLYFAGGRTVSLRSINEQMQVDIRRTRRNASRINQSRFTGRQSGAGSFWSYVGEDGAWLESREFDEGERAWRTPVMANAPPAVGGDSVYVGHPLGSVVSMDTVSSSVQWTHRLNSKPSTSPVYSDGGVVYAATRLGEVLALDAGTGDEIWSVDLIETRLNLAVSDGLLFVTSRSKTDIIRVLDGRTGEPVRNVSLDDGVTETPTAVDDTLLFPSGSEIFAVEDGSVAESRAVVDEYYEGDAGLRTRRESADRDTTTPRDTPTEEEERRENGSIDRRVKKHLNPSIEFSPLTPLVVAMVVMVLATSAYIYRNRE